MTYKLLNDQQRSKSDNNDDSLFYSQPKYVHHLDICFRLRLNELYKKYLTNNSIILDLMSSWVSHLPEDYKFQKVIGHGLNRAELESNVRLDSFWIQDLNQKQKLPLDDLSVDYCLMVAAWQYLQEPEEIAMELRRIIRPKGKLIVSFSNRAFWTKTPRIWAEGSDFDRLNYISSILISQGWSKPELISEQTFYKGFFGLMGCKGDPFFSVIATR